MMLRTILRVASLHARTPVQSRLFMHHKTGPKTIGLSQVRLSEKEEEDCLFPTFSQFNVETKDRVHSFSVPCDKVIKFIKFGAINKQVAVQYCHYLVHLARTSDSLEDANFYSNRCRDLMDFLLRNDKDIPVIAVAKLLCDVSDTCKENCRNVCSMILKKSQLSNFRSQEFSQLIGSCYKFGLWREANQIYDVSPDNLITFRICDSFVDGVIRASEECKQIDVNSIRGKELRSEVVLSLQILCQRFRKNRTQFITRRKSELIDSLRILGFDVAVNPQIKMSGRCTKCDTNLPLFDQKSVAAINNSIKDQILKGSERGLYLNTSPNDANRFETFLREIHAKDKRPIDCVIDGLNIAYKTSTGFSIIKRKMSGEVDRTYKIPKPETQSHILINTIIRGDMLKLFKKILVVGKHHMTKWPGLLSFFEKHNIHFYSSYNNSKDDLFQLFASTLSPKTIFITNDFLRDHLASLGETERTTLERWIDTHQAWICNKTLRPIWPTPYEKIAHFDSKQNRFHLPVIDFNQLDTVGVIDPPPHLNSKILTWLCFEAKT